MQTINLGDYQNPTVRYTRNEDKVVVESGNRSFTVGYLEFYVLLLWARKSVFNKEVLSLVTGEREYCINVPYGVTVKQRVQELLKGASEVLSFPLEEPKSYKWDDGVVYGSDLEHVYLCEWPNSYRPVYCIKVTMPLGMEQSDIMAYLQHAQATINADRQLPANTEDKTIVTLKEGAIPTFLGINEREIFQKASPAAETVFSPIGQFKFFKS